VAQWPVGQMPQQSMVLKNALFTTTLACTKSALFITKMALVITKTITQQYSTPMVTSSICQVHM
jgi:hypothetical protein